MTASAVVPSHAGLDVRALSKMHGVTPLLLDVTFAVRPGELVAVVGEAGAGKTTLVRLLAGHLTPSGGRIRLGGLDLRSARLEWTDRIGYVPQVRAHIGNIMLKDLLHVSARARQVPPSQLARRVGEVAATCGIEPHLRASHARLTRDARARAALAQALLHRPHLLLLDNLLEDLADADRHDVGQLLGRLRGSLTIVSTGIEAHALHTNADRVLRLDRGRLTFNGPLD